MQKYQKQIALVVLMLVFTVLFSRNVRSDFPLIFEKDLHAHDESSNSVVAANITREFFPPMVRVNPLNEVQGNWMEGPYWQHIPPMFAYVPYIFFTFDGEVTIEMKRLSFAFLTWLTGLLFIFVVYKFHKSLWAAAAATLASIFWVNTPFTHELITGYAFGVSDIVLAFTVVASFGAMLWYLHDEKEERKKYPIWKLIIIGAIVALPIMAKNLLGAIPAATLFIILLRDYRFDLKHKKLYISIAGFLGMVAVYYLPFLLSSPGTFKNEILLSFLHMDNLEGWGRPWHYYLTNYLPDRYLFGWTWIYFVGLIIGLITVSRQKAIGNRLDKILLIISGGWFLWNLIAITLVESKIANFIYQTYLLSLFFIIHSLIVLIQNHPGILPNRIFTGQNIRDLGLRILPVVLFTSILITGWQSVRFIQQFNVQRALAYDYQTEHEKFYQAAEEFKKMGVNENDLIIFRVSDNDCWFRYYTLFLTGAESKTLLEMNFHTVPEDVKEKYQRLFFVFNKQEGLPAIGSYSYIDFDLTKMETAQIESAVQAFLQIHKTDIEKDILRIKKDKTSCQWLVPDTILNAP